MVISLLTTRLSNGEKNRLQNWPLHILKTDQCPSLAGQLVHVRIEAWDVISVRCGFSTKNISAQNGLTDRWMNKWHTMPDIKSISDQQSHCKVYKMETSKWLINPRRIVQSMTVMGKKGKLGLELISLEEIIAISKSHQMGLRHFPGKSHILDGEQTKHFEKGTSVPSAVLERRHRGRVN